MSPAPIFQALSICDNHFNQKLLLTGAHLAPGCITASITRFTKTGNGPNVLKDAFLPIDDVYYLFRVN